MINILTQKKIKKYSGFSNLNLNDLSNEIESFFMGQKFGYIAEVKPQVFTETDNEGNKIIKCFVLLVATNSPQMLNINIEG